MPKIICYTGIGSRKNGIHTRKNFVRRMLKSTRKERKVWCKTRSDRKKYPTLCNHPKSRDVKGWIKWSGATVRTKEECKNLSNPIIE